MTAALANLEVKPLDAPLGADIEGLDIARGVDEATFAEIEKAWAEHLVLRFRNQKISDIELMNFSGRFGKLDRVPQHAPGVDIHDPAISIAPEAREYVTIISNVKIGDKAIGGLGNYEALWHTDMSYNEQPPTASLLYGIEVPPSGGNTGFASMYLAYEKLPEQMRRRIEGLTCIHDASRDSAGQLRAGYSEVSDLKDVKGARHPLVRTHPVTGRKALFLGRRRNAYVVGLEPAESDELLDKLWAHATQPAFCWEQVWKVGDLVIWDNRCVMHRRDGFDNNYRRVMHRTQICGDKPF